MSEANKKLLKDCMEEVWNHESPEAVEKFFATDCVRHDPSGLSEVSGIEEIKQVNVGLRAAFPDSHYTVEDMIAEGDKVVTRWTVRGTHKGEMMGIKATGKTIETPGINISRIEGGKIAEEWIIWDTFGFMKQLGVG